MANTSVERDIARAKDLRKQANSVSDATAKNSLKSAADRLERRAGRKASKIGRKRKVGSAVTVR